jgi:hypothetical protein
MSISVTRTSPIPTDAQLRQITVRLNNAQIKELPSTPLYLLPTPGIGKVLQPILMFLDSSIAVNYTNVGSTCSFALGNLPLVANDPAASSLVTDMLANAISKYHAVSAGVPTKASVAQGSAVTTFGTNEQVDDLPLSMTVFNGDNNADDLGDFTGGDDANTLTVTVLYMIVNIDT